MTAEEIMSIIREEDFDVTLSGGDPLFQPDAVKLLSSLIKKLNHTVWVYTGFTYEEILKDPKLRDALKYVDVLVDGPYIESLRDPDLQFRGSSNQRIINLNQTNFNF